MELPDGFFVGGKLMKVAVWSLEICFLFAFLERNKGNEALFFGIAQQDS